MSQRRLHYPTQGIGIALPTSVRVIPDPKTIIGLRQSMHCLNNALSQSCGNTCTCILTCIWFCRASLTYIVLCMISQQLPLFI